MIIEYHTEHSVLPHTIAGLNTTINQVVECGFYTA